MLKLAQKSLFISTVVTLSLTNTVFAQVPTQRKFTVAQASNFTCAPHLRTYVVKSLSTGEFGGVRCVKFISTKPGSNIPRLAWYGEGRWGGNTYRHVGHGLIRGSKIVGYASDINGNGEDANGNFPGNLNIKIISGHKIQVTGAWDEEWNYTDTAVNYTPLSRPTKCGGYFDEYRVSDLVGSRNGRGLRCVLRVGARNMTWFGNGEWEGTTYSHLGTRSTGGYGAADICAAPFGPTCNNFSFGSLKLTTVSGGFNVTGAWSEKWRK